jgi:hypothetical protein
VVASVMAAAVPAAAVPAAAMPAATASDGIITPKRHKSRDYNRTDRHLNRIHRLVPYFLLEVAAMSGLKIAGFLYSTFWAFAVF